jgi:YHS domain-containing protein
MKHLKQLLAVALLTGLATVVTVRTVGDEKPAAPATAGTPGKVTKAKPYPLAFCVVSDEKFEGSEMKPFEMVHEGQTIKFCCKNCVKDFKADPKKYLTKLADEVKKQEAAKARK